MLLFELKKVQGSAQRQGVDPVLHVMHASLQIIIVLECRSHHRRALHASQHIHGLVVSIGDPDFPELPAYPVAQQLEYC